MARVQAEKERKQVAAKLAAEQKAKEEAYLKTSTENEATKRLEEEERLRTQKAMEDSLAKIAGEREKVEREIAAAKQKAEAEEAKRKAAEASATKLKEEQQARAEAEGKNKEESARLKAEEEAKAKLRKCKKGGTGGYYQSASA